MNILRTNRKRKRDKKNNIFKLNSKKLLIISLLFMMTTLAWVTYQRILNVDLGIHVNAWNIKFYQVEQDENGNTVETEINNVFDINLTDLYPGMDDVVNYIKIVNNGETDAAIFCSVVSDNDNKIHILGEEYEFLEDSSQAETEYYIEKRNVEAAKAEDGRDISKLSFIDEQQLDSFGEQRFPFQIKLEYTNEVGSKNGIKKENTITNTTNEEDTSVDNVGYLKITTSWLEPNELDEEKNELDTKWGYDVADFIDKVNNGEIEEYTSPISFKIQINAILPRNN